MASDTTEEARENETPDEPKRETMDAEPETPVVPGDAVPAVEEERSADAGETVAPASAVPAEEPAPEASPPAPAEVEAAGPPQRALDAVVLDTLFRAARTQNAWRSEPVPDSTLHELFELLKWAPTSANCSPARFLFLRTPEAKERLKPALSAGNIAKTMQAPVTVIVAYDPKFFDLLPRLWPHDQSARSWFAANETFATETAFRNGSLQGAYLILAARSLGLDCGPMSGFNRSKVDEEFFAYRGWKSNFLCNLGYGDPVALFPRSPRLDFDDACELL